MTARGRGRRSLSLSPGQPASTLAGCLLPCLPGQASGPRPSLLGEGAVCTAWRGRGDATLALPWGGAAEQGADLRLRQEPEAPTPPLCGWPPRTGSCGLQVVGGERRREEARPPSSLRSE